MGVSEDQAVSEKPGAVEPCSGAQWHLPNCVFISASETQLAQALDAGLPIEYHCTQRDLAGSGQRRGCSFSACRLLSGFL